MFVMATENAFQCLNFQTETKCLKFVYQRLFFIHEKKKLALGIWKRATKIEIDFPVEIIANKIQSMLEANRWHKSST